MKTKTILKYGGITLGVLVILSWIFILAGGALEEGPAELTLHLISEGLMALLCIIGGLTIRQGSGRGMRLLSAGLAMMVYSVLNALGYYAGQHNTAMMIMLGTAGIMASVLLLASIRR